MGDRGVANYEHSGQTTEWEDILINKGIVQEDDVLRGKGIDPNEKRLEKAIENARNAEIERLENETLEDKLQGASLNDLDELEDELDDDEDAILQRLRDQRIAEMKAKAAVERFGEVYEISKADWVKEVTEASRECWVLAHLYQDSIVECRVMEAALVALAKRFKAVKFIKIRSTQAVENWPESRLPTLFMYRDGALAQQLIRIDKLGGKQMTDMDLEWHLASQGVLETELEEDPRATRGANSINLLRAGRGRSGGGQLSSDDEADDDS